MTADDLFMYYYHHRMSIKKIVEQPFHMFKLDNDPYGGVCISENEFGENELGFIDPNEAENVKNKVYRGQSLHLFGYYIPHDEGHQFQRECAEEFKSYCLSQNLKSKYDELFQYLMTLEISK